MIRYAMERQVNVELILTYLHNHNTFLLYLSGNKDGVTEFNALHSSSHEESEIKEYNNMLWSSVSLYVTIVLYIKFLRYKAILLLVLS